MTKQKPTDSESARPSEHAKTDETRPEEAEINGQPETSAEDAAKLRAELEKAEDRALRSHAELDNYRKRAARELEERLRYANMGLLRDLLPVVDNVERAIAAAEKHMNAAAGVGAQLEQEDAGDTPQSEAGALLEGFKMVHHQLEDVLRRHHCHRIEALHKPFDPNLHHAVMQQPSEEHPANTVLMVTQQGYQLHDRVVRPSQVIVSRAP
ncbi:MAG: nucleotide exchange factor GrpE [Planctomycetaceae bacterium]|nr:nucleotide exchange factor GrpE [Planctomycetaceae bacterium]